jgi:hypothetical protein
MGVPNQPVTLTVPQLTALNEKLSYMRHDVNNHIALMMAAMEMIQFKPDMTEKMLASILEQLPKITGSVGKFSDEFEKLYGITRP